MDRTAETFRTALGIAERVQLVPKEETGRLRRRVKTSFASVPGQRIWEQLDSTHALQLTEGWRYIDILVPDRPAVMFVDDPDEQKALRFMAGSSIVRVLSECPGFPICVTNDNCDFLVCFNDHDFLIAAGSATGRLDGVRTAISSTK